MYDLQPEKKSQPFRRGCVNFLAIIGGIALALVGTAFALILSPVGNPLGPSVSTASASQEVIYKIRFEPGVSNPDMDPCAEFSVTYAMPSGTAQKDMEACKGVTHVARFRGNSGDHLYLSIQNTRPRNSLARFSCMISVDGTTVAEVESIGSPNIASCSMLY